MSSGRSLTVTHLLWEGPKTALTERQMVISSELCCQKVSSSVVLRDCSSRHGFVATAQCSQSQKPKASNWQNNLETNPRKVTLTADSPLSSGMKAGYKEAVRSRAPVANHRAQTMFT